MTVHENAALEFPPLVISRTLPATRDVVFGAWSSADQVKRWFCPAGYSVPQAKVDLRVGGAFDVCMRSPEGLDHWTRGAFVEVVPNVRLVIDMQVDAGGNVPLFGAHLVVTFAEQDGGVTRMEVAQRFTLYEPQAARMIEGAPQGWAQTLERLEREVARDRGLASGQRSVTHASFCLERRFDATPARVYQALSDPAAKAKWFGVGAGVAVLARAMEVRNGGREHLKARWPTGMVSTFDAVYLDVVPAERLVYAYTMHLDERKISASLATLELQPAGAGTRLVMTEQGAFLDGYDDAGSRERGSNALLDALGSSLKK